MQTPDGVRAQPSATEQTPAEKPPHVEDGAGKQSARPVVGADVATTREPTPSNAGKDKLHPGAESETTTQNGEHSKRGRRGGKKADKKTTNSARQASSQTFKGGQRSLDREEVTSGRGAPEHGKQPPRRSDVPRFHPYHQERHSIRPAADQRYVELPVRTQLIQGVPVDYTAVCLTTVRENKGSQMYEVEVHWRDPISGNLKQERYVQTTKPMQWCDEWELHNNCVSIVQDETVYLYDLGTCIPADAMTVHMWESEGKPKPGNSDIDLRLVLQPQYAVHRPPCYMPQWMDFNRNRDEWVVTATSDFDQLCAQTIHPARTSKDFEGSRYTYRKVGWPIASKVPPPCMWKPIHGAPLNVYRVAKPFANGPFMMVHPLVLHIPSLDQFAFRWREQLPGGSDSILRESRFVIPPPFMMAPIPPEFVERAAQAWYNSDQKNAQQHPRPASNRQTCGTGSSQ